MSPASVASSSRAKQPPQPDPKKLAEAAAALKREIAANKASKQLEQGQQTRDPSPSQPEYKTLDAYLRENSASSSSAATPAAPVVNAWAKPPAPTPASHALSGAQQQRHRPAEPTRLPAAAAARDLSPVSPAATATTPRVPPAGPGRPAAAAAASAGLPPMPQPPPPPPPPAAAQQAHGMHHVPSIHSHPLTSQGSTVSLMSQASAGANGQLPVGAEYVGDEAQLTKAQRKNLKRAEKKKQKETGTTAAAGSQSGSPAAAATAAAVSPGTGPGTKLSRLSVVTGGVSGAASAGGSASISRRASSTSDSLAAIAAAAAAGPSSSAAVAAAAEPEDAESVALMHELAVHALLAKKTLALVASLQCLGFAEWQAAAAVQRHGSDLEDAVAWLLDGGAPDPDAAAAVSAGCVADVSIVEELRLMEALGAALPQLPRTQLYIAVADAGGDLDKAAAAAMGQHAEIVAAAEAAAAAAAANSPLASVSVTASPTSTTSAQQVQQAQKDHLQQQQPQVQQQPLSNGLGGLDASQYSAFGGPSLGLYAAASTAPSTLAPAAPSVLPPVAEHSEAMVASDATSSGFASWFNPAGFGLGASVGMGLGASIGTGLTAHPLTSLASTSSLGVGALESTGSGFGSYVPGSATAAAAAAMGSNIWGAGSVDAASSAAGWGQLAASSAQQQQTGESLSGSLFAQSGLDSGLGGWGSAGGLGGSSGFGLLGNQGSSSAMDPYAPFGSGAGSSLFASSSLAAPAAQPSVSTPGAGDAGLQQSRLFSSYGVSQPSLFGSGAAAQPQQQQVGTGWGLGAGVSGGVLPETAPSADDDDLEGLLATLMCH